MKLKCIQPGKDDGWDIVDTTGKVLYSDPDREKVKVRWQAFLLDIPWEGDELLRVENIKEASDGAK